MAYWAEELSYEKSKDKNKEQEKEINELNDIINKQNEESDNYILITNENEALKSEVKLLSLLRF